MSDVKGFSGIRGRDLESGRFPTAQMFGLRLRLGPLGGEGGSGVIQHSGLGGDQRLPEAVVAKQGVGEHDELADDGGDRDLVRFAAVGQPLVEDAHVGVAAAGGSAGHVEHLCAGGAARRGYGERRGMRHCRWRTEPCRPRPRPASGRCCRVRACVVFRIILHDDFRIISDANLVIIQIVSCRRELGARGLTEAAGSGKFPSGGTDDSDLFCFAADLQLN